MLVAAGFRHDRQPREDVVGHKFNHSLSLAAPLMDEPERVSPIPHPQDQQQPVYNSCVPKYYVVPTTYPLCQESEKQASE